MELVSLAQAVTEQKHLKSSPTESAVVCETATDDTAIDAAPEMTENTPETRIKVLYYII